MQASRANALYVHGCRAFRMAAYRWKAEVNLLPLELSGHNHRHVGSLPQLEVHTRNQVLPMAGCQNGTSLFNALPHRLLHAAEGILACLVRRELTGRGGRVEVSLLASVIDLQFEVVTTYLNDGHKRPHRSTFNNAHAYLAAPYGIYQTADGYIALAMLSSDAPPTTRDSRQHDDPSRTAPSSGATSRQGRRQQSKRPQVRQWHSACADTR